MEQHLSYVCNDSHLVHCNKKYLYGIKEAHWDWYSKMDSFLINTSFSICHYDPNLSDQESINPSHNKFSLC